MEQTIGIVVLAVVGWIMGFLILYDIMHWLRRRRLKTKEWEEKMDRLIMKHLKESYAEKKKSET